MDAKDLKSWNRHQLQLKSATLHGRIDGLVARRRDLFSSLQDTVESVDALEELRRSVDIGQDQDTLEHLRQRELAQGQEIADINAQIERLQEEVEPVDIELAGRPLFDEGAERRIDAMRADFDEQRRKRRNEHLGLFGRIRVFLFGE